MYRSPAEIPRARLPLLEQVTIKTPCKESWDGMVGDDRVRFCARCSKNVYDLSAMTQDEAETFLATHLDDDAPCVRLYRRPDGRVLTSECVQGARMRHARKVGAGLAAGLCAVAATTVAMANVHIPDGHHLPRPRARIDPKRLAAANFDDAANAAPVTEDDPASPAAVETMSLQGTMIGEAAGFSMGAGVRRTPKDPTSVSIRRLSNFVTNGLPADAVDRVVRQQFGRFRVCYEAALAREPRLEGEVEILFVIERDGSVSAARRFTATLTSQETIDCMARNIRTLTFPTPETPSRVYVSYRVSLKPTP